MTTPTLNDAQKLSMAKRIAREHNMFIVTKPNKFLLYSVSQGYQPVGALTRNQCAGTRSTVQGIYILVRKCCNQ